MENYRKVHLREVLINNTSRLRYSAQPEECGLSHSRQTEWLSVPLSQAGKWLPQPPKATLHFRCSQRSRSALGLNISDKAGGERKSIWPTQLAAVPGSGSANAEGSCNLCIPSLCRENCATFRWSRQKKGPQGNHSSNASLDTEKWPTHLQTRTKAYKNLGKLNIIILVLSGFSPGRVPSWQRDSSSLRITLFKSFPAQGLGRP